MHGYTLFYVKASDVTQASDEILREACSNYTKLHELLRDTPLAEYYAVSELSEHGNVVCRKLDVDGSSTYVLILRLGLTFNTHNGSLEVIEKLTQQAPTGAELPPCFQIALKCWTPDPRTALRCGFWTVADRQHASIIRSSSGDGKQTLITLVFDRSTDEDLGRLLRELETVFLNILRGSEAIEQNEAWVI
jgi:hypothetical protein